MELAETKLAGKSITISDVATELAGLTEQPGGDRIDTVVLACTHFPLLAAELASASAQPLMFVDGAAGIARRVAHLVGPATGIAAPGRAVFTRAGVDVDALAPALKGYGLGMVEIL